MDKYVKNCVIIRIIMKELAIMLNNLTSLDSFILTNNGRLHFTTETSELPDFIKTDRIQTFTAITNEVKSFSSQDCLHYRSGGLLNYLAVSKQGLITVLGPFLTRLPDNAMISEILIKCHIAITFRIILRDYLRRLSVLENRRIIAIADTMSSLNSSISSCHLIRKIVSEKDEQFYDKLPTVQAEEEIPDISIIIERYKVESALMQAVSQGDKKKAKEVVIASGEIMNMPDRVSGDPLRSLRDISITLNTLYRVAAKQGGLHPRYLHSISEKYAILLEKKSSFKEIFYLMKEMREEYCDAVKYRGTVNYSRIVSKAIQFILSNLDDELSLIILAEKVETHSSYLSRLFKKETGLTVTQYINIKRVNEAVYLLMHTTASIADISMQVGYQDSGYFSRVFHKIKGMTPTEWRNSETDCW